jgi:type IV pilus assembly protein PilQ
MSTPLPTAVFALLALLPAVRVVAQAAPANTPADAPAAAAATATPPAATSPAAAAKPDDATATPGVATKGKDAAGRDTLSVDFPDEDIRNILRNVADLFELNIIMPDSLQGKTTIKLRDVTWRQIFQSVLDPVNYTFVEEGNIIKIVSKESINEEPVVTEIFLINYAKATDIAPIVTSLIDTTKGKMVVDIRTNSLVITERPTRLTKVRPIIEQLDRATDQVMIESKFVEVTDSDVKNIGVNWSSLAAYQIRAGNIGGTIDRTRDQTGSSGFNRTDTNTNIGSNVINNSNTNTRNNGQTSGANSSSSISSANGTPTVTSTTGTTGTLTSDNTSSIVNSITDTGTNTVNNVLNALNSLTNNEGTTRALSAVFSASDFNLVLSALQQVQKSKIVSNPTIVTLNNKQASINIGQERPIPNYTYNQQTGTYAISGFTFRQIGVILKVTPQVNSRGDIQLTVDPEVSQSTRDVDFQGASIPVVESRKASTTVSLKDGYTMGIGGLLQSSNRNGQSKVPVLGSIPVLGRLFRSDNKNEEQTNLIIFITAKTMSADGAPIERVFESGRVRNLELTPKDLPGYRDGSSPFISGESSPVPPGPGGRRVSEAKK